MSQIADLDPIRSEGADFMLGATNAADPAKSCNMTTASARIGQRLRA